MTSIAGDLRPERDVELAESLARTALALARAFAGGATLWCTAPAWPADARHVAVEFVHPVIIGKRALPAVAVNAADPTTTLRPLVRSRDAVLAMGPVSTPAIDGLMRRAEAWGALRIWIGGAEAPREVDHAVRFDHDESHRPAALLYHVLWELTHVCFEHPGLLAVDDGDPCAGGACTTCSDEGRLGEVVEPASDALAIVRTARGPEHVDTSVVGPVAAGDLVLIHAGIAISAVTG